MNRLDLRYIEDTLIAGGHEMKYNRMPKDKYLPAELLEMERNEEAINGLREIKLSYPQRRSISESSLNQLGYDLMNKNKIWSAIEVFKLNVELYPNSFNTFDSLGEAYMNAGNTELAIINYQKSVEINPNNTNGIKVLEKLKSGKN